eukprot:6189395-Pleurochrysis_carterae.AAC.1
MKARHYSFHETPRVMNKDTRIRSGRLRERALRCASQPAVFGDDLGWGRGLESELIVARMRSWRLGWGGVEW